MIISTSLIDVVYSEGELREVRVFDVSSGKAVIITVDRDAREIKIMYRRIKSIEYSGSEARVTLDDGSKVIVVGGLNSFEVEAMRDYGRRRLIDAIKSVLIELVPMIESD